MALSTQQKFKILRLLCYPRGTTDTTSLDYSKIVTDKLNAIADEAQVEVEQLLDWIEQTEDQLDKAINSAGVKRIDDIEFFGGGSDGMTKAQELRSEKRKYLSELSDFIGIPNKCSGGSMGCLKA